VSDTIKSGADSIAVSSRRDLHVLTVVYSPDAALTGRRIPLNRSQTLFVGRDAPGGVSVNDERMSKLHLLVVSAKGEIECADSGSTNGTFVNGVALKSATLRHGDVIRAGNTLFVLSFGDRMMEVSDRAARVARTTFPILIQGETGTGKELLARAIHEQSDRAGPFVPLNCATLPRDLAAAELFGHARGAFSGAVGARIGLLRAAEGGTLFLDEVGDLPLELQPAFLRALEERRVRPVGSEQEIPVDFRLIAATHVELEEAVGRNAFRADLLARLAHVVLRLPPLRERRAEILALAREFCEGVRFSANAAEALLLWDWPRNVRELRSVVEVAAHLGKDRETVGLRDLGDRLFAAAERVQRRQAAVRSTSDSDAGPHPLAERRERLRALFEAHEGNVSKVAEELGKPRAQVYRWLKALGIDVNHFRKV
jgi:DNA-binding NtrC family response regulator